jgi:hypothetical protein
MDYLFQVYAIPYVSKERLENPKSPMTETRTVT